MKMDWGTVGMESGIDIQNTEEEIFKMVGRIFQLSTPSTSKFCKI